jgi:hypothetical protein
VSKTTHSKLKFFIPADFQKGTDAEGREIMVIKGIASTGDLDSQDEYLDPSGMDLSGFKWVNWNHHGSKDPSTIIGEPIKKVITPDNQLYIEAILYPDVPMAKTAYNLMKALQNSPSGNRLGFSVEGKVISKDPTRPNRIAKSRITGVALCPVPINGSTWADILKGELPDEDIEDQYDEETEEIIEKTMSVEGSPELQPENVEGDPNRMKNKVLTKSETYIEIFNRVSDKEETKLIYPLVEKLSTMSKTPITQKTIEKAFEILELTFDKTPPATKGKGGASKFDSELLEKAESQLTSLINDGSSIEDATEELINKGFNTEMVNEVAERVSHPGGNHNGSLKTIEKGISDLGIFVKQATTHTDQKLMAVGSLFSQLNEQLELIKSEQETLLEMKEEFSLMKADLDKFLGAPQPRKSTLLSKAYTEKFQKSEDGSPIYNVRSKEDLMSLKKAVQEMSGINKGENFDQGLAKIAQNIEIAGGLSPQDVKVLQAKGFNLVSE